MVISVMVLVFIITSLVIFPFSVVVVARFVVVVVVVVVAGVSMMVVVVVMGASFIIGFPLELIAFDLSVL